MTSPLASPIPSPEQDARRRWMSVLARASTSDISACLTSAPPLPAHVRLRGPEAGLVMMRGRIGGGGGAFNVGEVTVTRCTVRAGDTIGHAYVMGRDAMQAELAARLDAALLTASMRETYLASVIEPLASRQAEMRAMTAQKAAATKVDFFTMATMRT